MKKIKGFVKKNYKLVISFILGMIVCIGIGVSAVATKDITYDNSTSGLTSTNLQGAIDELTEKAKTHCPDGYTCTKKPVMVSFESDSWVTIAEAVKSGTYPYSVGDTKTVDMGDLGVHTVRVANTSSCTNGETSKTACGFVVEFADVITEYNMNSPPPTNVGGWPASELRDYVSSTIYNALPSDLQNVIASTKVVSSHGSTSGETNFTSTDKLYLLSTTEVYGITGKDTAESETRQLDYYKNNGVTISNCSGTMKQYYATANAYPWWLRSAIGTESFVNVSNTTGEFWTLPTNYSIGISPAFRIA